MVEHKASELHQLWQISRPIALARFEFAPVDLTSRLAEFPEVKLSDLLAQIVTASAKKPNGETLRALSDATKKGTEASAARFQILREIDQNFFNLLVRRELRCFGYETPRRISSEPVEMLPSHWTVFPDWAKGEFRSAGLHLIELRVLAPHSQLKAQHIYLEKPRGRPTFKAEITAAFHALLSEKSITINPLSLAVEPINSWIKTNLPNTKAAQSSISYDAINKALRPIIQGIQAGTVDKL